jgi:hypothetical protein
MPHAHHASVESLWISVALLLVALVYLRQWLRVAWLVPDGVKGWRAWSFFVGLLLVWVGLGSPLVSPRSRSAHGAHGSTSVAHDAGASLILLGAPLEATAATPGATEHS